MLKKIFLAIIIILAVIIVGIIVTTKINNKAEKHSTKKEDKIEEIKEENGYTGSNEIYEIQQGYNDINILVVKPSIEYMVAYSGMIKKDKVTLDEAKDIFENNYKYEDGIFVEENSRKNFLEMLDNELFNNEYRIENDGYLKINKLSEEPTKYDEIISKIIDMKINFIIDISSICYIVDNISGEILDFNFEKMDLYQTYEAFEDENKLLIFITENTKKILSNNEIIDSVISLMESKLIE